MKIFLAGSGSVSGRSHELSASELTKGFVQTLFPDRKKTLDIYVHVAQFVPEKEVDLVKITGGPIGYVEKLGKKVKIPVLTRYDFDIVGDGAACFVVEGLSLNDEFYPWNWLEDWLLTNPLAKFPVGQVHIIKKGLGEVTEDLDQAFKIANHIDGHTLNDDENLKRLVNRLREIKQKVDGLAK